MVESLLFVSAREVVRSDAVGQPFSATEHAAVISTTGDHENDQGSGGDQREDARRRQVRILHACNFAARSVDVGDRVSKINAWRER